MINFPLFPPAEDDCLRTGLHLSEPLGAWMKRKRKQGVESDNDLPPRRGHTCHSGDQHATAMALPQFQLQG